MVCNICDKELTAFNKRKIYDGFICKDCCGKLPKVTLNQISNLRHFEIMDLIENTEREKLKKFEATASYGKLHIDEFNGLFAISDKLDKDGKPMNSRDIFKCTDLMEAGVYCVKPTVTKNNKVICNIEFKFRLIRPVIDVKLTLKVGTACFSKRTDSNHLEWDEPGDLSMFRNMFNQMLRTENEKYANPLRDYFLNPENVELFKAKTLFMVDDEYTEEEIRSQRKRLMKVYHPDADENTSEYAKKINEAYRLLLGKL